MASFPQIRRFFPQLIEAVVMESTAPAQAVLDAFRALGTWLADKLRTTRLADTEIPFEVWGSIGGYLQATHHPPG
ncbi:MAG: hypothetical protein M0Z40_02420 [Actinomycetota bacterium]|nr:hypothetical protein [Actinomycetota bacterium]